MEGGDRMRFVDLITRKAETLVIAPLVSACGGTVIKMSGCGLGHTGGTLDKMESIPGCCVKPPLERFYGIVRENGVSVAGQTAGLVPADKKMYALREAVPIVTEPAEPLHMAYEIARETLT